MLAVTASRLPTSGMWRRVEDEKTKEKLISANWQDQRVSKEDGETKGMRESKESRGLMGICESWRDRVKNVTKAVDRTKAFGVCMPAEWKLQKMYKQLKVDNNKFTTWLVESVYPSIESLPSYITLSTKETQIHDKYDIIVNKNTELARQPRKVPPSMLALLDRLIAERTKYSHWMSQKSTDNLSALINDSHTYYIKVLEEVKLILAERMEPEAHESSQTESPAPAETASMPSQTQKTRFRKRKNSSTTLQGPDSRKAAKTESTTSKDDDTSENDTNHSVTTPKQQQTRAGQPCAIAALPMSYAAVLRIAVVA